MNCSRAIVGFGMFGAMLTLPLYLQIVTGLNPTESGFALIPMIVGLMIAAIGSRRDSCRRPVTTGSSR